MVSLHDVAPATAQQAMRWRDLVAAHTEGPACLLVVPRDGGGGWAEGAGLEWLRTRRAAGDEIALHGLTHRTPRGADGPELRWRSAEEVHARLRIGAGDLAGLGIAPSGFVAPAYAHPRAASRACRHLGLAWWATRLRLSSGAGGRTLPALGVGASTPLRRRWSPAAARGAARALARAPAVRLDLHPADLRHPPLEAAGLGLLELLLAQGRRPVLHEDLALGSRRGGGAT